MLYSYSEVENPRFKDPCATCEGDCGVACHWDDCTVEPPTRANAIGIPCSIHPYCKGYTPRVPS